MQRRLLMIRQSEQVLCIGADGHLGNPSVPVGREHGPLGEVIAAVPDYDDVLGTGVCRHQPSPRGVRREASNHVPLRWGGNYGFGRYTRVYT